MRKAPPKKKKAATKAKATTPSRTTPSRRRLAIPPAPPRIQPGDAGIVSLACTLPTSRTSLARRARALRHLSLSETHLSTPYRNSISRLVRRIERELPPDPEDGHSNTVLSVLATSSKVEAKSLLDRYFLIPPNLRDVVTIDDLIAAAKLDPSVVLGLLTEEIHRQYGAVTSVIASVRSPSVMKARASYALTPDGHSDAKLILQTSGVAPVPKNQTTFIKVDAGHIGDNNLTVIRTPTLEEIVAANDTDLDIEPDTDSLLPPALPPTLPPTLPSAPTPAPVTIDSVEDITD